MIILGLDPGLARTGFGVIDTASPSLYVRCGCLTTSAGQDDSDRLADLGRSLTEIIKKHKPGLAVIEQIFFNTNVTTAIQTAQARGVLLYILRQHNITPHSLTPLQIKMQLTGYGQADKQQVQQVIKKRLNLASLPRPDDAADALAAAICAVEKFPLHQT